MPDILTPESTDRSTTRGVIPMSFLSRTLSLMKSWSGIRCYFRIFACFLAVHIPLSAGPRVAFLVDDPDLEALLLAGLGGAETLSRRELPRVAAERLLAGAEGNLELTGADVVLVVEQTEDRGSARLVACPSGATIFALDFPKMPVGETARWIVTRVQPSLGAAADPDRPRISLTGLRFVTDSPENRIRERTLNLMLTARLQARGALVLERWRMGDLVFEKHITRDDSPFWKTAGLVDGSLSSPASGGEIQASIRIRDASGREIRRHVDGDNIGELADKIASHILNGQDQEGRGEVKMSAPPAGLEIEAESFLAEAGWMLDHGLPRDAWQATESALALGTASRREAEMLRVKAAAMCAYPDPLIVHGVHNVDVGHWKDAFDLAELPERVAFATMALTLAGDYWNAYPVDHHPGGAKLEHPANLGVRTLYTGLRILRMAYDSGWKNKYPGEFENLRKTIQRNSEALLLSKKLGNLRATLCSYLTVYAAYWNESPGKTMNFYKAMLDTRPRMGLHKGQWPVRIRKELAGDDLPHPPFLTGLASDDDFPRGFSSWRLIGADESPARTAWAAFLDELEQSSDVLSRADGLALRWQSTADTPGRMKLGVRMAKFLAEEIDSLSGEYGYAILLQFDTPIRKLGFRNDLIPMMDKLQEACLAWLGEDVDISPEIISGTLGLLAEYLDETKARRFLDALKLRRDGLQAVKKERGVARIDNAISALLKKFPLLFPKDEGEISLNASLWIAEKYIPGELRRRIGFSHEAVVWMEGHLWVMDPFQGHIWKIHPPSGRAVVYSMEKLPDTNYGTQLLEWEKRLVATTGTGIWILDIPGKTWTRVDLPPAFYRIGVAHRELWAVTGTPDFYRRNKKQVEGTLLYRIGSDLRPVLVASSRRRPPVHPLDATLSGQPRAIFPYRDGNVAILENDSWPGFIESGQGLPLPPKEKTYLGRIQLSSTPGLILREWFGKQLTRIEKIDATGRHVLISHPDYSDLLIPEYPWPEELNTLRGTSFRYTAALSKDGLDILVWSRTGAQGDGASKAWLMCIGPRGRSIAPVRFAWSDDYEHQVRRFDISWPEAYKYPEPVENGLIPTNVGLVITGRGMAGFWFIPNSERDKLRESVRPANYSAPESIAGKHQPD
ncbi:hypothetical protein OPIT5_13890 [Opitutaceae bacterium TAV5]|nr:hypothetical protein OPIT5_13890 [Opitutaceae bacterium TAV5]